MAIKCKLLFVRVTTVPIAYIILFLTSTCWLEKKHVQHNSIRVTMLQETVVSLIKDKKYYYNYSTLHL